MQQFNERNEQNEELKPYRSFEQLQSADSADMSNDELTRYFRAKRIPSSVRLLLQKTVEEMRKQVMDLEKTIDETIDFLNGEA